MSLSAFSSEKITIAWAARVSFAQLGARLLSYFDTRASITTFRLAARYTSSTAFRKLPEELILMIANQVSDQSFCEDMRDWVQAQDCLAERCTPSEHLGTFCSREDGRDCPLLEIEYKMEQAMDDHENTIIKYGSELINIVQSSKIAKCVSAFTREFSIRPYFMLKKNYDHFCMRFETDVKAYLILTLTPATLHSSSGDDTSYFDVDSVLDLEKLTDLTVEQRRKFSTAAAVLNLHAYDAREDESGYRDDLEPCECDCSSFGDEKHFHSDSESDESVRLESAISKKDIKQQDGTEEQKAKEDSGAVYMEALSPSARSSSNQTPPKPKLEKKELQPELMMLACGNYYFISN